MANNPKPLWWLAVGAIIGLFVALSTKAWEPVAFLVLTFVMAGTYLYAWRTTPRRTAR